jgi:hypothetical protein
MKRREDSAREVKVDEATKEKYGQGSQVAKSR